MKKEDKEFIALAVVIMSGLLIFIILFLSISDKEEFAELPYTVRYGDSLDKLYYEFGGGSLEKWRYEVKKLNGMEESGLYTGDEIIILVSKEEETKWK